MPITRLRINVGYKEEEGIKLPIYKNVVVEEEFIKVFRVMENLFSRLNKIELLLTLFLVKTMTVECVVYNNKIVRTKFINYVKELSKGKIDYKHQSVHNAFAVLKKEGVLITERETETVGAYFVNPAFVYIGDRGDRNKAITLIEKETNERAVSRI